MNENIQVIVILDNHSSKFEPFSSNRPESLLPLMSNKTLLDASLDFLISVNQFKEIILLCSRYIDQIEAHLNRLKFDSKVNINIIEFNNSLGDCIQVMSKKGLLKSSTFILMTATSIVSNISIQESLKRHREHDKENLVMTILCSSMLTDFSISERQIGSVICDSVNRQVLKYESRNNRVKKQQLDVLPIGYLNDFQIIKQAPKTSLKKTNITSDKFKNQNQKSLRLSEAQIYICELKSLKQISSNYETIEHLILEILCEKQNQHQLLSDRLVSRFGSHFSLIDDLNSYFNECMRLLTRADLMLDISLYDRCMERINVYSSKSASIGERCLFRKNVFIQDGCQLGDNCELENCILGEKCYLGLNVKVTNSIVWSHSRIGSNSTINACLIGSRVNISSNVRICENCLFGDYVKIKNNINRPGIYKTGEKIKKGSNNLIHEEFNSDEDDESSESFKRKHFLVWKPKMSIDKKYYLSDEELTDLAKIDKDEELDRKLMQKKTRNEGKNTKTFLKRIETSLLKEVPDKPSNDAILEVLAQKQACLTIQQLKNFDYFNALIVVLERNTALLKTYYASNRKSQFQLLDSFIEFAIETDAKINSHHRFLDKFISSILCSLVEDFQILKKDIVLDWYEKQNIQLDDEDNDKKIYIIKHLRPFIELIKKEVI